MIVLLCGFPLQTNIRLRIIIIPEQDLMRTRHPSSTHLLRTGPTAHSPNSARDCSINSRSSSLHLINKKSLHHLPRGRDSPVVGWIPHPLSMPRSASCSSLQPMQFRQSRTPSHPSRSPILTPCSSLAASGTRTRNHDLFPPPPNPPPANLKPLPFHGRCGDDSRAQIKFRRAAEGDLALTL